MLILAFAASTRRGSVNQKLVTVAADLARDAGAEVDVRDFAEFAMPLYDGDDDAARGLPAGARALVDAVNAVDAILVAAPEYNYSIPGTLKNAIDWVSRARPMPWRGKSIYLMSASPGAIGGARGLWHTRVPFEACGALVFPDMFSLPHADDAFGDKGDLVDAKTKDRLAQQVRGFVRLAEAVAPICAERAASPAERERAREIARALEEESTLQPRPH